MRRHQLVRPSSPLTVAQSRCARPGDNLSHAPQVGLDWLVNLYENGLSGILGDDVGLGKQVQSIALLAHLKEHNVAGPFMVVGPLSTLHSWKNEFAKRAPGMDAIIYNGPEERAVLDPFLRGQGDADKKFPVLITSYEIVIRDAKHLKRCGWKFVIIDEGAPTRVIINEGVPSPRPRPARSSSPHTMPRPRPASALDTRCSLPSTAACTDHRLKNMNGRLIKKLKAICNVNPAQPCTRLLLTGTPLQHDLTELWSLLNFSLPNCFDDADFKLLWAIKGEMEQGVVTKLRQACNIAAKCHPRRAEPCPAALPMTPPSPIASVPPPPPRFPRQILRPFLLRRLKADVEQHETEARAAEARVAAEARAARARAAEARAAKARACERVTKIKIKISHAHSHLLRFSTLRAIDPRSLSWSIPQTVDSLRREMQAVRCLRTACTAGPRTGVRPPHCLLLSVAAGAGAMYVAAVAGGDCVVSVDAARLASAPCEEALDELMGVFQKARSALTLTLTFNPNPNPNPNR